MLKNIDPLLNAEVLGALRAMGHGDTLVPSERMAFYEKAKAAYCVIASGEGRFYGCFIFTKGVIGPGTTA